VSSGPRIKHVCRYESVALGKPLAKFPPVTSSHLHLSALPSQEKERFLVDKKPGMCCVLQMHLQNVCPVLALQLQELPAPITI